MIVLIVPIVIAIEVIMVTVIIESNNGNGSHNSSNGNSSKMGIIMVTIRKKGRDHQIWFGIHPKLLKQLKLVASELPLKMKHMASPGALKQVKLIALELRASPPKNVKKRLRPELWSK